MEQHQFQPDLPPPANTVGVVGWLRKNLFNGPVNSVVTLVLGYFAISLIWYVFDWAILKADWLVRLARHVHVKVLVGSSSVFVGNSSCTGSTHKLNYGVLACSMQR